MSKGDALNLEQALAASRHHLACRRDGDQRVIVDGRQQLLTIHLQRRSGKHWMADDNGGGVRYLMGVLRDGVGSYLSLYPLDGLSDIEQIRTLLPTCYQSLLSPVSDDWMPWGEVTCESGDKNRN
jgi:hypothetical protein